MPSYRIYFVDPEGRLGLHRDIECADDQTALEQARRFHPVGLVEAWQGTRLVGRLEADAPNGNEQEQQRADCLVQ